MTPTSSKKVAVLMGGWTSEREVSLVSGGAVCKALTALGHEVIAIDVQRDAAGLLQASRNKRADDLTSSLTPFTAEAAKTA